MRATTRFGLIVGLAVGALAATPHERSTLRLKVPADSGYPSCLSFSPDGKLLACATDSMDEGNGEAGRPSIPAEVFLWDGDDGALLARVSCLEGSVNALAWSGDGAVLCIAADDDEAIIVWDVKKAKQRLHIEIGGKIRHPWGFGPILEVSPNGKTLVGVVEKEWGTPDIPETPSHVLAAWDLETGASLWTTDTPGESVAALAISPNGKVLAALGWRNEETDLDSPAPLLRDFRIGFREMRTGKIRRALVPSCNFHAEAISFTADGRGLVGISRGGVGVYDIAAGALTVQCQWHFGGGVRWTLDDQFAYSPRRGLAMRGATRQRKDGDRLHFDLLELGKGRIVAEADGPRVWTGLALSPTLDRYAFHRAAYGRREVILRDIPWTK